MVASSRTMMAFAMGVTIANAQEEPVTYPGLTLGGRRLLAGDYPCSMLRVGFNCTASDVVEGNGICLLPATGVPSCWDVCDSTHTVKEFTMSGVAGTADAWDTKNTDLQLLVSSVRLGKNLDVTCGKIACQKGEPCTQGLLVADWCPPGAFCGGKVVDSYNSASTLGLKAGAVGRGHSEHSRTVPVGRGMCVVDATGPGMRRCLDMCNTRIPLGSYAAGAKEGTEALVVAARDGSGVDPHVCPEDRLWLWVLLVLVLICIIVAVAAYIWKVHGKKNMKSRGLSKQQQSYPNVVAPETEERFDLPLSATPDAGENITYREPVSPQQVQVATQQSHYDRDAYGRDQGQLSSEQKYQQQYQQLYQQKLQEAEQQQLSPRNYTNQPSPSHYERDAYGQPSPSSPSHYGNVYGQQPQQQYQTPMPQAPSQPAVQVQMAMGAPQQSQSLRTMQLQPGAYSTAYTTQAPMTMQPLPGSMQLQPGASTWYR